MPTRSITARQNWPTLLRVLGILALVFLEVEIVEIALRNYFDSSNYQASFWAPAWHLRAYIFVFAILFVPTLIIATGPRARWYLVSLIQAAGPYRWATVLSLQVISYTGFVLLTYILSTHYRALGPWTFIIGTVWLGATFCTAILAILSLAPKRFWLEFVRRERLALFIASMFSVGTASIVFFFRNWRWPGDATFQFSDALLRLFHSRVVSNLETRELGTPEFQVEIAKECSDYEGIVLGASIW